MSGSWWKAVGVFALAMVALSFISESAAISLVALVGLSTIMVRIGKIPVKGAT